MKFFEIKNKKNQVKLQSEVKNKLKKYSFCVIKNFNSMKIQKNILKLIKKKFDPKKDKRITGLRKIGSSDYQRIDLGDSYKNIRFMRVISFSEWNKYNKTFFKLIDPIIKLRNNLSGIKKEGFYYPDVKKIIFRKEKKGYALCDFIRMIQYPSGGGFLIRHDDYDEQYAKGVVAALLPVTAKKKRNKIPLQSYNKGGLYFIYKNKKIIVDNYVNSGDLVLFNTKIEHGVNSIDPDKKVNFTSLNGRITLNFSVASFYK